MSPASASDHGGSDRAQGTMSLPVGTRLGDYEITDVIRHGGFAIVYGAIDRATRSRVAIKEYMPATLADRMADGTVVVRSLRHERSFRAGMQGFLDEARMLAGLDQPALVKVLHIWEQHATAYMAMPFYEGQTLKDVLRESPKPGESWLKALMAPLLDALAVLHEAKRWPRDVAPDNIVVRGDGTPLLLDCGAARRIIASIAEDVTVVLKPGFTPLEQYAQDPSMPEGPWTDIYGLASVLFFAITGNAPPTPATRIVSDRMKPLGEVTSGYSELFLEGIHRGLAVRPEHRPQSIAEFRTALGIPEAAPAVIPIDQPEPPLPAPDVESPPAIHLPEPTTISRSGIQDSGRVRVLGDGTRVTPAPVPEQRSPIARSPVGTGARSGWAPWKLVALSVVVVGLAGGGLLLWSASKPVPPTIAGDAGGKKPAPTAPQAEPPVTPPAPQATPELSPPRMAPDVPPPKAPETPPDMGSAPPPGPAPSPAPPPPPPAPKTGTIQFAVKPWGEIFVDGRSRGVSPPVKELSLPEGRHQIEIRNSTFPGYKSEVDVKAGAKVSVAHAFKSQ